MFPQDEQTTEDVQSSEATGSSTSEAKTQGLEAVPEATVSEVKTQGHEAVSEPAVRDEPAVKAEPTVTEEPAVTAEPAVKEEPADATSSGNCPIDLSTKKSESISSAGQGIFFILFRLIRLISL